MNIYVGNLSLETTEDELCQEFSRFGEVLSVTIMNDIYIGSGQPRGYGYIQMASKEEGIIAITNLEGATLKDRVLNVVEALPLTKYRTKIPDKSGRLRSYKKRERKSATSEYGTVI